MFVQDLHSVELVRFFVFDQHNSAERAGSQSLEPVEIIQACCALRKYIDHRLGCKQVITDWFASGNQPQSPQVMGKSTVYLLRTLPFS